MAIDQPSAHEVVIFGQDQGRFPDLRLLHYNDVYHIDASSAEPVGGIARFMTLSKYYRDDDKFRNQAELLTFFSGDAWNPSLESSVTKGSHMVPFLNNIGTDAACIGNHDLDFGVKQFRNLASQCKFPWLLANVLDPELGENVPLANCLPTLMLTSSNGIKVGLIGLAEREWLDTINSLPPNLIYKSASATAKELAPKLREQGAEIIIALTHQREPNDNKLAENVPEGMLDLVLGGHDHFYNHSFRNGCHVLRSGTDFKNLSYIEAWRRSGTEGSASKWDFKIIRRDVVASISEDEDSVALARKLTESLKAKLEKPIGYTLAPLDARFVTVRTKESNYGNFVCDLMKFYYQGDCCLIASGTIRGDQIYAPGIIRLKDILDCFPFEDPVIVIMVTGEALLEALENSVSMYPALEGRFPQVSGIEMEFDPNVPRMKRIKTVLINGQPLDTGRKYKLVTRGYMGRGKDGYDALLVKSEGGECEEIVSEENGVLISTILRQYFMSLKVVEKWRSWSKSLGRCFGHIHEQVHLHHPVVEPSNSPGASPVSMNKYPSRMRANDKALDEDEDENDFTPVPDIVAAHERELAIMRKVMRKWRRLAGLPGDPALCDKMDEGEFTVNWTKAIAPRLEGRIKMVQS
ncbi:uncharacterized protein PV09_04967 [Verruconis gallopava]|uniref:5'-Nucleotidase C-terminal domain-containing protein n=1 Tax=Verruconis gallopava TaxID=253628 RepID=A0A0D2ACC5_9PEZI|nr:uncharacterized protein PV09_04967 [Verruconis gallopava]KIW04160.1 hypothetical protein PV09_04967 [Verruconis gallopava]